MKKSPILRAAAAAFLLSAAGAQATVTLQFSSATLFATNWANSGGAGGGTLVWGILIDTTGNGFLPAFGGYSGQGASVITATPQTLLTNGSFAPTDDVLFLSPNLMSLTTNTNDGAELGMNRIGALANIPMSQNGINDGDAFAIVWFNQLPGGSSLVGQRFGIFTNASFVLPADGSTTPFTTVFTGPDPLKPMTGLMDTPEPSTLLLSALGALGLLRRRRG